MAVGCGMSGGGIAHHLAREKAPTKEGGLTFKPGSGYGCYLLSSAEDHDYSNEAAIICRY